MVVVCKKKKKPHPAWVFLRKMPEKQLILFAWPYCTVYIIALITLLKVHREVLCCASALMMDQREKYAPKGISSEFVGGDQTDPIVIKKDIEGAVQLVFITPESIIENPLYRNMLLSQPNIDRLGALVVDDG